jgi:hypothetical protein
LVEVSIGKNEMGVNPRKRLALLRFFRNIRGSDTSEVRQGPGDSAAPNPSSHPKNKDQK